MFQPGFAPAWVSGLEGGLKLLYNIYIFVTLVSIQYPMAWRQKKGSAEVNNLNRRSLPLRAHYVLRLDVHVDNVAVVQVLHLVKICIKTTYYCVRLPLGRSGEQRGRSVTR